MTQALPLHSFTPDWPAPTPRFLRDELLPILTYLDWLAGQDLEPIEINAETFTRASTFI